MGAQLTRPEYWQTAYHLLKAPPFLTILSLLVSACDACTYPAWRAPQACAHLQLRVSATAEGLHTPPSMPGDPPLRLPRLLPRQVPRQPGLHGVLLGLLGRALGALGNANHDIAKGFLSVAVQVSECRQIDAFSEPPSAYAFVM